IGAQHGEHRIDRGDLRAQREALGALPREEETRGQGVPEGVWRGRVRSRAENLPREVGIDPVEDGAGLLVRLDELELEERRLADQLLRALPVEEAGELDQDAVVALLLKRGLGDAELVDSIPDDLHRLVDRVLGFRRAQLGLIDLEQEVHPTLKVEAQLDRLLAELGQLLQAGPLALVRRLRRTGPENFLALLGAHRIELER